MSNKCEFCTSKSAEIPCAINRFAGGVWVWFMGKVLDTNNWYLGYVCKKCLHEFVDTRFSGIIKRKLDGLPPEPGFPSWPPDTPRF